MDEGDEVPRVDYQLVGTRYNIHRLLRKQMIFGMFAAFPGF